MTRQREALVLIQIGSKDKWVNNFLIRRSLGVNLFLTALPRKVWTNLGLYDDLTNIEISSRYWKEPYFKGLASIKAVADKHGLTLTEVALRWISHHSLLKREYGDAVLIGASSLKHIEQVCIYYIGWPIVSRSWWLAFCQNLLDLEKGPLRMSIAATIFFFAYISPKADDVVKALDEVWIDVKAFASPYYHWIMRCVIGRSRIVNVIYCTINFIKVILRKWTFERCLNSIPRCLYFSLPKIPYNLHDS